MKIKPGQVRWPDDLSGFDPRAAQVVVEAEGDRLAFQVLADQGWFTDRYSAFLNEQNHLRRMMSWCRACGAMCGDGFDVLILPSAEDLMVSVLLRWPVDQERFLL